ncbi:hypothetical protein PG988_011423 [Apiospora saccharicola]
MPQHSNIAPAVWALSPVQSFSQPTNRHPTPTLNSSGDASNARGRKRKRGDVEESDVPPKLSGSGGLACPFYKHNPHKYVDCLIYSSFDELKHLKAHLERNHKWDDCYCPICGMMFKDPKQRDHHVRERSCVQRELFHSGVRPDQQEKIDKIAGDRRIHKTKTDKWYRIWEVVFPTEEAPDSPYLGWVEKEMASNILNAGYMNTTRYQDLLVTRFPDFQGDAQKEGAMRGFLSAFLMDSANYAAEMRGDAAPVDQPATIAPVFCDPQLFTINEWVHATGEEEEEESITVQ